MDQIRIIKEMREKDAKSGRTGADIRPRFMVFENVPGLFSVNEGRDFAAVLEETIRVSQPEIPDIYVPVGGWPLSGAYVGTGFSVAWRVLDAQFWGVPQRRRRIALIADFGGESAPKVLFEQNSLHRYIKPCEAQREGAPGDAADCTGTTSGFPLGFRPENVSMYDETATTLCNGTRPGFTCGVCYVKTTKPHSTDEAPTFKQSDISPTLNQFDTGDTKSNTFIIERGETARTLSARYDPSPCIDRRKEFICYESHDQNAMYRPLEEVSETVRAKYGTGAGNMPMVVSCDLYSLSINDKVTKALTSSATDSDHIHCMYDSYIIRRLTPLECTRLQGYPDRWLDIGDWYDDNGRLHKDSDSVKYRALGNSIAIPPWLFVLGRLNEYCEEKTMASLFDGISGFPLIWSYLNGKENCVFSSEIDPFCRAVSRIRFPDTDESVCPYEDN